MNYIGILAADRMGQLSQQFCMQKMREAGIGTTMVCSQYFSGSVRADFKFATWRQLLRELERFSADDLVVCSRLTKAYKAMADKGPPPEGKAYQFSPHLDAKTVPMTRGVADAAMRGSSMSFTVGSLRTVMRESGVAMGGQPPLEEDMAESESESESDSTDAAQTAVRRRRVIVGLASHPPREAGMLAVVRALSPQCDEMHVALNEYSGDRLAKVLDRLKVYKNVTARAYAGQDDLGSQNKFRAVGLCSGDDVFISVDDDIMYPPDYVEKTLKGLDRHGGRAIVSYHGSLLERNADGSVSKNVVQFRKTCPADTRVHMAGTGCGACVPAELGLGFDVFDMPKNTGDDELLAIWARDRRIPMVVLAHPENWLRVNEPVEHTGALWRNGGSYSARLRMLADSGPWPDLKRKRRFFRVIIPVYGSGTLERALLSIAAQSMDDYAVVVCDDHSPEADAARNEATVARVLKDRGVFIRNHRARYAGGARNAAMDVGIESDYTLFLDADDVFVYSDFFKELRDFIVRRGSPDVVVLPFLHHSGRPTTSDTSAMTSPAALAGWRYPAPWTKCVRSSLCQRFQEGVRRSNDVLQHFRVADNVKSVIPFNKVAVKYMSDGETTMFGNTARVNCRSADAVGSILLVAGAILTEEWKHDYMRRAVAQCVRANVTRGYPEAVRHLGGNLERYVKVKRNA